MAVATNGRTELLTARKWRDRETSPERTKVWIEHRASSERKVVPVVYYLCRNGHLEHPHFMEVPLSSLQGLFLRDVINRLDFLRGKGMASLYSWASKRSYRNGFVWQDLSENDIIHPVYGIEYILKGSELLENSSSFRSCKTLIPPPPTQEPNNSGEESESPPVIVRRRNQSWSNFDPQEYKVYKTDSAGDAAAVKATDAATQTDDRLRRRRSAAAREELEEEVVGVERGAEEPYRTSSSTAELSREEISPPPPSSSSTEASETVSGGVMRSAADIRDQTAGNDRPSGRMKASAVLLQLISCVSGSPKPGESITGKDQKCVDSRESREYGTRLHRDAWNQGRLGLK